MKPNPAVSLTVPIQFNSLVAGTRRKGLTVSEAAEARCPEREEPADDAELPTRGEQRTNHG